VDELRVMVDRLRELLTGSYVVLLTGAVSGEKLRYVVAVSPDLRERLPAGKLAKLVGGAMGGGGGGRADIAEGGGDARRVGAGQAALRQTLAG